MGRLEYLLEKYSDIFSEELGDFAAKLHVDPGSPPKFFKPRTVPYAIRDSIMNEIDRLERAGILKQVTHSEWATPIIAVKSSTLRRLQRYDQSSTAC